MNTKLLAPTLGALLLAASGLASADGWRPGAIERSIYQARGDHGWRPDRDRHDWGRDQHDGNRHGGHSRGKRHHGHGYGHHKPHWHHHYRDYGRYRGGWQPHGYDRDGVTIIFRGSFY